MFIYNGHMEVVGVLPASFEIITLRERSNRSDNSDFRMFSFHGLKNQFEAFFKPRCDFIFVANADIFQMERIGMSGGGALRTPRRIPWPVSPFDQVEYLLDILL